MRTEIIETPGIVKTPKGPVLVDLTLEGVDYPSFYRGHGHAFEKDLIACIPFACSDPDSLMTELNYEWFFEDETWDSNDLEAITDELIESLIDEEELNRLGDIIDEDLEDADDDSPCYEGPYIYGYLHVYKVTEV